MSAIPIRPIPLTDEERVATFRAIVLRVAVRVNSELLFMRQASLSELGRVREVVRGTITRVTPEDIRAVSQVYGFIPERIVEAIEKGNPARGIRWRMSAVDLPRSKAMHCATLREIVIRAARKMSALELLSVTSIPDYSALKWVINEGNTLFEVDAVVAVAVSNAFFLKLDDLYRAIHSGNVDEAFGGV